MERVAQKLHLPLAVVYHAYILHSGNSHVAQNYLTSSFKTGIAFFPLNLFFFVFVLFVFVVFACLIEHYCRHKYKHVDAQ